MANRNFVFTKTVAVSGTQEPLKPTRQLVACAVVQCLKGNTGYVTVGDAAADYAGNLGINLGVPSANSTPASAVFSSTREVNEVDLNAIYIDVQTGGNGVVVYCTEA